jgi:hypothetical protein
MVPPAAHAPDVLELVLRLPSIDRGLAASAPLGTSDESTTAAIPTIQKPDSARDILKDLSLRTSPLHRWVYPTHREEVPATLKGRHLTACALCTPIATMRTERISDLATI